MRWRAPASPSAKRPTPASRSARRWSRIGPAPAYYPGSGPIWVKLVVAPDGRLLGGQIVGTEGAAKRIDVLAACIWTGMAVDELELLDLSYAPPYSGVYDPVLVAARAATKVL